MLLDVGADLLQYLLPHGTTWFNIHDYSKILNFLFTIKAFDLSVHVIENSGRKHFSFKHGIMVLAIFILVVFHVLDEFNRPYLPSLPDTNYEDEDTEGRIPKEEPAPSPGIFQYSH